MKNWTGKPTALDFTRLCGINQLIALPVVAVLLTFHQSLMLSKLFTCAEK